MKQERIICIATSIRSGRPATLVCMAAVPHHVDHTNTTAPAVAASIDPAQASVTRAAKAYGSRAAQRWKAGPRGLGVLILLCLAVYLPGLASIAVVDRDEARFAQASRQMFESVAWPAGHERHQPDLHAGGWMIPMVGDRLRLNKPPLIYWLQAGTAAILTGGEPLHDAIWMYRLPSVLSAILATLFTWRLGISMWDARVGLVAGALIGVCPMVIWDAHQARADQLFLACTTGAMLALWSVLNPRSRSFWQSALLLGIAMGIGTLAKGLTPVFVGLAVLSWLVLSRRWSWRGVLAGLMVGLVALAIVLPWGVAVGNQVGWDTYTNILTDETIGRSQTAKEGHGGPPGYHLVLLPVLFWPGALVTGAAVVWGARRGFRHRQTKPATPGRLSRVAAWWRTRRMARAPELFCLCWIFPAWLLFEVIGTKLPHYTLPLYPAIALLSARALVASEAGTFQAFSKTRGTGGRVLWCVLGIGIMAAIAGTAVYLNRSQPLGSSQILPALGSLGGMALVFAAARQAREGRLLHATRRAILAMIIAFGVFLQFGAPAVSRLGTQVRNAILTLDPSGSDPIGAIGYVEDSLIFHTRGRAERLPLDALAPWMAAHSNAVLVFNENAHDHAVNAGIIAATAESINVAGLNLGNGRRETVIITRCAPAEITSTHSGASP